MWSGPEDNPTSREKVAAHFLEQAGWNEGLGSPFTASLLRFMHADLGDEGPIEALCGDWPGNPRKDALGLRVLGALHHAVLTGTAPQLATVFPADNNTWDATEVWGVARAWLVENVDAVRVFMETPPQTNETRRSIALLPGFLKLAAQFEMPMHLLELGASAGLNQNWDRFNYQTDSWSRAGDSDVLITADWQGSPPAHLNSKIEIGSRSACDLNPLDINDPAQMRRLKSYTWPDQPDRLSRLDAAIDLAIGAGTHVDQADAELWLADKLAKRPCDGLTVVYHSVFLIYPPKDQIQRIMKLISDAGQAATERAPVAWLCYESEGLFGGDRATPKMYTRLQIWPGGETKLLTRSDGHITGIEAFVPAIDANSLG